MLVMEPLCIVPTLRPMPLMRCCTIILQDVTAGGNWVKGTWEFSVIFKIISKLEFYFKMRIWKYSTNDNVSSKSQWFLCHDGDKYE